MIIAIVLTKISIFVSGPKKLKKVFLLSKITNSSMFNLRNDFVLLKKDFLIVLRAVTVFNALLVYVQNFCF